eukprot:SAG31_NODE_17438_length_670_cov_1.628722_1_plen_52_part_01
MIESRACNPTQFAVTVHLQTTEYGNEITWQIDEGTTFGPFPDNSEWFEAMCL